MAESLNGKNDVKEIKVDKRHSVKLSLHSDLHLEMNEISTNKSEKFIGFGGSQADIFILAGDIDNGIKSIELAKKIYKYYKKPVIFVAGNHEYYGHDIDEMDRLFRQETENSEGVYYLENSSITLHGVRFLGCTLWSNFRLYEQIYP